MTGVAYTINTTTTFKVAEVINITSQVYNINTTVLAGCGGITSASQGAQLQAGTRIGLSWFANDTVDVFVFNSTEFEAFQSTGMTSPNLAAGANSEGTLRFNPVSSGSYYVVVHNPYGGTNCQAAKNVRLYGATGTATQMVTMTSTVTAPAEFVTSSYSTVTETTTTHVTSSCSNPLWAWLLGIESC